MERVARAFSSNFTTACRFSGPSPCSASHSVPTCADCSPSGAQAPVADLRVATECRVACPRIMVIDGRVDRGFTVDRSAASFCVLARSEGADAGASRSAASNRLRPVGVRASPVGSSRSGARGALAAFFRASACVRIKGGSGGRSCSTINAHQSAGKVA